MHLSQKTVRNTKLPNPGGPNYELASKGILHDRGPVLDGKYTRPVRLNIRELNLTGPSKLREKVMVIRQNDRIAGRVVLIIPRVREISANSRLFTVRNISTHTIDSTTMKTGTLTNHQ